MVQSLWNKPNAISGEVSFCPKSSRVIDPNTPFSANASTQAVMNGMSALKREALDCEYSVAFCRNYSSNLLEPELIERLEPGLTSERTAR